ARRLLPASGLVVIVTLIASRLMLDGLSQADVAHDAVAASLFVANIRFWNVGTDYLAQGLKESPLLHFWSLAVEEQFYLVWPSILLLLVRFARIRRAVLVGLIAVMWTVSLVACVWLTYGSPTSQSWAFFMLPARAWELLSGAALALSSAWLLRMSPAAKQVAGVLGWAGLGAIVAMAIVYVDVPRFPGFVTLLPVVATMFVVVAGTVDAPQGPLLLLRVRPLQWLGAHSYAIYLWHFPMLVLAGRKWATNGEIAGLSLAARLALLLGSVGLAAVSQHFIENPVRFSPVLAKDATRSLVMGAWVVLLGVGGGALLLNNPPTLSAGGTVAEVTLASVGGSAPDSTAAGTVPGTSVAPGDTTTTPAATTTTTPVRVADASKDNPPALAALVAANLPVLTEALAIGSVPDNLNPSLGRASDDLPQIYDNGCILDVGNNQPKDCIYGDPNGATTIVLFGDSHAAEWMPGLHAVAAQNGWRLIVHTKKACPHVEIPTSQDPNGTDCAVWRERVIERIGAMQPDLVIMSSYRYKQVGSAAGRDPDTVWREGLDLTLAKVRPLADHVLLLGDSATPREVVPNCLAGNLSNVPRCVNSRSEAVKPGRLGVERDLAEQYQADFVPTSDWLCTDTACPVIVGNVLMYRDDSHITATASVFLAPYLEATVRSVLA
ncbi:MAG: acyltransferase family protein, partial [Actinomycetota bacterium]|nr:acyltransferase family protein [Actinomycetota bacterium]